MLHLGAWDIVFHNILIVATWSETLGKFLFFLRSSPALLQDDNHLAHISILLVNGGLAAHLDDLSDLVLRLAGV